MQVGMAFLAGFIAGEGHFWIRPNNAGQSWACGFQLVQREDNAPLVLAALQRAGVGRVMRQRARGSTRPQVAWTVQTISESLELAWLLDEVRLLGKKAVDYRIWRTAVARWSQAEDGNHRWPHMAELARTLDAHRRSLDNFDYTFGGASQSYLGGFLAGFASAEGHFGISREGHPRFAVKLRADDAAVLTLLASRFRVGRLVGSPADAHGHAQATWLVTALADLRGLVAVFDRQPPLGRTGSVYAAWRESVIATDRRGHVRRVYAERLRAVRQALVSRGPRTPLRGHEPKQAAYVVSLKAWARTTRGPYTATAYTAWRSTFAPNAPNRGTLARAFGSWREALLAAALPTDGCRSASAVAEGRATRAASGAAMRAARRQDVLRSVARCSADLGRLPAAVEYLRWRLEFDPGSPGQASIYRLFPGGWDSVLAAYRRMGSDR